MPRHIANQSATGCSENEISPTQNGDADIDVTAEGGRAAGKFDKNYIVFLGGTARYMF